MGVTVSVVIPTYNRVWLLGAAVGSVFAQTRRPEQLVVVDDGSTGGGTGEFLRSLEQTGARAGVRVDVVRCERSGCPGAVRNRGIARARGDLVAFLDDDDMWDPRKLARQVGVHEQHPGLALSHTREVWVRGGRELRQPVTQRQERGRDIFADSLWKCCIGPSTAMVRRDIFLPQGIGGFSETLEIAEDYEMWIRVCDRHPQGIGYLEEPLTLKCAGNWGQVSERYPYIERFRITALQGVLCDGCLTPRGHAQARAMLERKTKIWADGCLKRGRVDEAARYMDMVGQYG